MQCYHQWRLGPQVFRSVCEHTKVAGICTKTGQFSQPRRAAGGRPTGKCGLLSGRGKKTFEFASKLAEIAHRDHSYIASQDEVVRRNMVGLRNRVKNRTANFAIINATLSGPASQMGQTQKNSQ